MLKLSDEVPVIKLEVIKGINSIFHEKNYNFYVKKSNTYHFFLNVEFFQSVFSYIEYSFFICK